MADFNKVLDPGDWQNGNVNTVVEISLGSTLKVEYRKATATFEIDRVEPDIFAKPTNYGFIPQTLDEDGDELDTLIVINRHVNDLDKLNKEERDEFLDLLIETKTLIQKTISPAGFNIGMNLGRVAGAGCPGHLHIHVVPRWAGDINFMPVVSGIKVISQSLKTLHKELCDVHKRKN